MTLSVESVSDSFGALEDALYELDERKKSSAGKNRRVQACADKAVRCLESAGALNPQDSQKLNQIRKRFYEIKRGGGFNRVFIASKTQKCVQKLLRTSGTHVDPLSQFEALLENYCEAPKDRDENEESIRQMSIDLSRIPPIPENREALNRLVQLYVKMKQSGCNNHTLLQSVLAALKKHFRPIALFSTLSQKQGGLDKFEVSLCSNQEFTRLIHSNPSNKMAILKAAMNLGRIQVIDSLGLNKEETEQLAKCIATERPRDFLIFLRYNPASVATLRTTPIETALYERAGGICQGTTLHAATEGIPSQITEEWINRSAMYHALYLASEWQEPTIESDRVDDQFLRSQGKQYNLVHTGLNHPQLEQTMLQLPNGKYDLGWDGNTSAGHSIHFEISDGKYTILDQNEKDANGMPKPLVFTSKEEFAKTLAHYRIPMDLYNPQTLNIDIPHQGYEIFQIEDQLAQQLFSHYPVIN